MSLKTLLFVLVLTSSFAYSQQLNYKKGKVYNENNTKLSNNEVKELLSSQPELLVSYNEGKAKAGIGGFLLGLGGGLVVADLLTGATQDKVYPSGLTYVGLVSTVIAIPITIGHTKKIKKAIDGYNQSITSKNVAFSLEKITILSNKNGIGMQLSF